MSSNFDFFRDDTDAPADVKEMRSEDTFTAKDMDNNSPDLLADEHLEAKVEEGVESVEEIKPIDEEALEDGAPVSERAAKEIRRLKASLGEDDFELPADAKFKHKVNGEEVEVSVQDLLNNYSGKEAWDKKFSELDGERQVYKKDLDSVNKYVSEFAQISKENPVDGLLHLAKSVGIDPLQYKRQLREQLVNTYGDYLSMDEHQRSAYEQREELDYLRQMRETESKQRTQQQAQAELQSKYAEMQQTHSIDEERLTYLRNELSETYKMEPSPENVVELHKSIQRLDRVDEALKRVDPALLEDDRNVLKLESLLRVDSEMDDEQLYNLANKLWGNDVSKAMENLSKKVPKQEKKPEKSHTYSPKILSGGNINFFD